MQLNFTVDTDELFDHEGYVSNTFEKLFTDSLRQEIINTSKEKLASEKFKEFSNLASNTLVAEIKLRLQNFLNEEIVLTEGWGEKTFVGSIEDLIKKRFDEILLHPVGSDGKKIKGCTSVDQTWIQWKIEKTLELKVKDQIEKATRDIERKISLEVSKRLDELKESKIKKAIGDVFDKIVEYKEPKTGASG